MKEKEQEQDFFRIAAGFYQCRDLPENYLRMEDDAFYALLEDNAWEPFVGWSGNNIQEEIAALSACMEKIARDAYSEGYAEGYKREEEE